MYNAEKAQLTSILDEDDEKRLKTLTAYDQQVSIK